MRGYDLNDRPRHLCGVRRFSSFDLPSRGRLAEPAADLCVRKILIPALSTPRIMASSPFARGAFRRRSLGGAGCGACRRVRTPSSRRPGKGRRHYDRPLPSEEPKVEAPPGARHRANAMMVRLSPGEIPGRPRAPAPNLVSSMRPAGGEQGGCLGRSSCRGTRNRRGGRSMSAPKMRTARTAFAGRPPSPHL